PPAIFPLSLHDALPISIFVRALGYYKIIGRTVDDAAGEAFDKIAKLLGLGYPGGPEIEMHAANGDPKSFDLPRSMPESENFSFRDRKSTRLNSSHLGIS